MGRKVGLGWVLVEECGLQVVVSIYGVELHVVWGISGSCLG